MGEGMQTKKSGVTPPRAFHTMNNYLADRLSAEEEKSMMERKSDTIVSVVFHSSHLSDAIMATAAAVKVEEEEEKTAFRQNSRPVKRRGGRKKPRGDVL